jgi:uncharacterized protein (TIGR02611 family)
MADEAAPGRRGNEIADEAAPGRRGNEIADEAAPGRRANELSEAEATRAQRMRERLAERREAHLRRGRIYRAGFAVVGATVTLAGIAMLVTPGPALVVIPIGLAMLALEFAWAERLLDRALDHAEVASRKAAGTTRTQRILGGIATALALAAAVAAWLVWEIPLIPG